MSKKGFVHLILLFALAVVLVGALVAVSARKENLQKQQVGKVLSEKEGRDVEDESQKKADEAAKEATEKQAEVTKKDSENASENSNSSFSSNKFNAVSKTDDSETEIETENGKTKVKVKNQGGEFETEIEEGKEKTKFQSNNFKIEFEREGDKFVAKVKNENGEEVELEASEEAELFNDLENELEDDGIKIATGSADLGFVEDGRKVRTNFPLSVDPATGQLFVTTPAGVKAVAVLPSVAIENMIKAGVLTRVEEPGPTPSPTPGESSGSAGATQGAQVSVLGSSIELTEQDNQPVYRISGVKDEKLFGLLPVGVKLTTVVSASNGSLVDIQEGIFARILDLLSN